jgi:hypothetical protein
MNVVSSPPRGARAAPLRAVALAAVGWNLFGVVQFVQSLRNTPESLERMGMAPEAARVYASYPTWMTAAFAVGVFGGLAGSILLGLGRRVAVPVFAASLAGYLVLYVGDVTEGVFAAVGPSQVVILTTVVAIALGLWSWSRHLARRSALA